MNKKVILILTVVSFFGILVSEFFVYIFFAFLGIYLYITKDERRDKKDIKKQQRLEEKHQKQLYDYYLTKEGRSALQEIIDYYNLDFSNDDDKFVASFFSSKEGQEAISRYLEIEKQKSLKELKEVIKRD